MSDDAGARCWRCEALALLAETEQCGLHHAFESVAALRGGLGRSRFVMRGKLQDILPILTDRRRWYGVEPDCFLLASVPEESVPAEGDSRAVRGVIPSQRSAPAQSPPGASAGPLTTSRPSLGATLGGMLPPPAPPRQ